MTDYTDYTDKYEVPPTVPCTRCLHCKDAYMGLADIVIHCGANPIHETMRKSLVIPFEHCTSFREAKE